MTPPRAQRLFRKWLKSTFPNLGRCEEVDVNDTYLLDDKIVKAHMKDYPFEICLAPDNKILYLYPEQSLNGSHGDTSTQNYLLFDPDCFYSKIRGFYRIKDGDTLTLGGSDPVQRAILHLPKKLPARKLSISNDEGWLKFKSHVTNPNSSIAPLLKDENLKQLVDWRRRKLLRLQEIFGKTIELLGSDDALKLLQQVNQILENESHRPRDKDGKPGGVVRLPDDCTAIIVGDLHAKPDNLLVVLSQNNFLEALDDGSACLIIIGDAVHPEGDAALDEMDSSMWMMDIILTLKRKFPEQVFYLRGNHDSYSEEIAKNGIPQGLLWGKALRQRRGKVYQDAMSRFYELLPYVAYSRHFVTCHAAAPVSGASLEKLINIRSNPKLYKELVANRLKQANRPSGYSKRDVKRLRKHLKLAEDTPFIVGHTPLSMDDTLWENVGDIPNHTIVYSSDTRWVGLMAQVGDTLYPFRYPVEPIIAMINALPDESKNFRM